MDGDSEKLAKQEKLQGHWRVGQSLEEAIAVVMEKTLIATGGQKKEAAKMLKISVETLRRRMEVHENLARFRGRTG